MYKIILSPHEILRTPTIPVPANLPNLEQIIREMRATLLAQKDPEGVGLAANQVGLPYRLFLARFDVKSPKIHIFINPQILNHSQTFQEYQKNAPLEGCLSVPKLYGLVKRYSWVELQYQDEKGVICNKRFEGFPAVVIQHEIDHLDGKIFTERILEQRGKLYKIVGKDKKGKETWEELELGV